MGAGEEVSNCFPSGIVATYLQTFIETLLGMNARNTIFAFPVPRNEMRREQEKVRKCHFLLSLRRERACIQVDQIEFID